MVLRYSWMICLGLVLAASPVFGQTSVTQAPVKQVPLSAAANGGAASRAPASANKLGVPRTLAEALAATYSTQPALLAERAKDKLKSERADKPSERLGLAESREAHDTLARSEPAPPSTAAGTSPSSGGGSSRAVIVPALMLIALAGWAFAFARRRRKSERRHIHIIETASLGPKRSLVVARVNGETLILGASEAGITLLKAAGGNAPAATTSASAFTTAAPTAVASDLERSADVVSEQPAVASGRAAAAGTRAPSLPTMTSLSDPLPPLDAKLAAADEILDERPALFRTLAGGFAGLRGRKSPTLDIDDDEDDTHTKAASGPTRARAEETTFDDVLEDSIEDQELRRKLSAGLTTRVR